MIQSPRYRTLMLKRRRRQRRVHLSLIMTVGFILVALLLEAFQTASSYLAQPQPVVATPLGLPGSASQTAAGLKLLQSANGRPQLSFLPSAEEVWECDVVVLGGGLGGIAAASHAMKTGAQTCLIEASPWMGGQVSSQGVSALDESPSLRATGKTSPSWQDFKRLLADQSISLPAWTGMLSPQFADRISNCWVGALCFTPEAGARAAEQQLVNASASAPGSIWATATAFKGATFDAPGRNITAIYAVKRLPKDPNYAPQGLLSDELFSWYAWSDDATFEKIPIRLQAPPNQRLIVIDATDTGELVGWANIPHRLGSDAQSTLGEVNAPRRANPACTQAFTFPFVMAIWDDQGASLQTLNRLETGISREEHRLTFGMEGFNMFHGRSLFNYRRIVSEAQDMPLESPSSYGEMTLVNWNLGNDWNIIDDPLVMSDEQIIASGQRQNWMGGLSVAALRNGEQRSLVFAEWLMETKSQPELPLAMVMGSESPMGTVSGLSMFPYIREGRRIIGRPAYGQEEFMIRENDLRRDQAGGRNFNATAIALTHYDIDIHGCRYRNWQQPFEATGAGTDSYFVDPLQVPLESLIPVGIDNLLIGGKSLAVSHIANAMTRIHQGEWVVGAAAGSTAGWLLRYGHPDDLTPAQIVTTGQMKDLQGFLVESGLQLAW
ncbi:MAG: FAD-dependent oxidoreductase [Cyanobacteria bacterium]|nr:FAD-dependent oxidoreductase [Cyanobacteriota bacterium]